MHIYDGANNPVVTGISYKLHDLSNNPAEKIRQHLSDDPANTSFQLTNRYNQTIPLVSIGYNVDDGFILGGGVKFIRHGFRKQPYGSIQQINFAHSFSTKAYRFNYAGEWLQALGKADLLIQVKAMAPENTQNFFEEETEQNLRKQVITGNFTEQDLVLPGRTCCQVAYR